MTLTFRLRFHTQPGQSLWLAGTPPLPEEPLPLRYVDHEAWEVTMPLAADAAGRPFNYAYVLRQADGSEITDWGRNRTLAPAAFPGENLLVLDTWNPVDAVENVFYTEPFKKVLLADRQTPVPSHLPKHPTHTFRVKAPLLAPGQTLCLLGEGAALGNWQTAAPILLHHLPGADDFVAPVDLPGQTFPVTYKYGVFDVVKNVFVRFEDGANRQFWDAPAPGKHTVVNDGFALLSAPNWRGAGVAVPVFSLRSEYSFGVGEFADLKALADWGKAAGLKLIQLLPVNDTSATHTWKDSYPYAAISAFALHPQYINLAAVVTAKNRPLLRQLEPERQRLNALPEVDYAAVMQAKLGFLKLIFPSQRAATLRAPAYQSFFAENQAWLVPYAAFCYLRDLYGTPDFSRWPEYQTFDAAAIAVLARGHAEIEFHCFVQYHLHRQLQDATAHLHAAGLVLKGDIAIGVYRHGADAWQQPELYHLEMQAGAPPDPFAEKGQNWGFPTYNWPRMAADGFAWWKQRFAQMGHYFDAFRIDHILGFFRIWSSPANAVEGILGYFVPAIPIEPAEFTARGIFLDRKRFTQPFITGAVVAEIFGNEAAWVRHHCLHHTGGDFYALKPEFATQRQVERYFAAQVFDERIARLRLGLFDLISNVILLEVEGRFHFRFGMETTRSFQRLAPDTQARLRELYVDYFYRRQDEFWKHEGLQKLPALKRGTDMLICGEDLGMVPACVPEVMRDLGLLSLEIQRMPKNPAWEFSRPADAPYLSVVTPSTHDMSTIRGWWTENPALTRKFYQRELGGTGPVPPTATPEIVAAVVGQHLASPAMWSTFQLQDLLGMDGELRRADVDAERINVPANPNHYWRYRLHHTLEQLQAATGFNDRLRQLLREHGRA
jgi:4-alpha-glucanotransferase